MKISRLLVSGWALVSVHPKTSNYQTHPGSYFIKPPETNRIQAIECSHDKHLALISPFWPYFRHQKASPLNLA
jgi:hypothetical protein